MTERQMQKAVQKAAADFAREIEQGFILDNRQTVLDQAEKEMIVPCNAASKAKPPKLPPREPNYFQPEEIAAILDSLR